MPRVKSAFRALCDRPILSDDIPDSPRNANGSRRFAPLPFGLGCWPFLRRGKRSRLGKDAAQLVAFDHLGLQQPGGDAAQRLAVADDQIAGPLHRLLDEAGDLLIDAALRALAVVLVGETGHAVGAPEEGR